MKEYTTEQLLELKREYEEQLEIINAELRKRIQK